MRQTLGNSLRLHSGERHARRSEFLFTVDDLLIPKGHVGQTSFTMAAFRSVAGSDINASEDKKRRTKMR